MDKNKDKTSKLLINMVYFGLSGAQERTRTSTSIQTLAPEALIRFVFIIRHLRQFLRIDSHGEDSLSTHDLSLNVCQCGPNV